MFGRLLRNANDNLTNRVISMMVVHEFCHQWFGNSVTVPNEGQLYVQEGSTELLTYYARSFILPQSSVGESFALDELENFGIVRALKSDALGEAIPVVVLDPSLIADADMFYYKGAVINQMFLSVLGYDKWMTAAVKFVRDNFNGTADYLAWIDNFATISGGTLFGVFVLSFSN